LETAKPPDGKEFLFAFPSEMLFLFPKSKRYLVLYLLNSMIVRGFILFGL